jgi:hypothetical protein
MRNELRVVHMQTKFCRQTSRTPVIKQIWEPENCISATYKQYEL